MTCTKRREEASWPLLREAAPEMELFAVDSESSGDEWDLCPAPRSRKRLENTAQEWIPSQYKGEGEARKRRKCIPHDWLSAPGH